MTPKLLSDREAKLCPVLTKSVDLKYPAAFLLFLLLSLTLPVSYGFANPGLPQANIIVKGKVTNQTGEILSGVTIRVKSSGVSITSDEKGNYSVAVPALPDTLVFSFVGYETLEAAALAKGDLSIRLNRTGGNLNEVVVVGYGTQGRKGFTGSAARITQDAIKDVPVQSFDQALAGKAAGVSVALPNGVLNNPPVIRVRGVNSISLSSFPLIVIDGIPVNTGDISSNSNVPNNALSLINPADIESVDILKDAASTAIYGSRAAAGVMVITTKKGKSGKAKTSYDAWVGVATDTRIPDVLDAQQYMDLKNEAVLNSKILSGNQNNNAVASALYFPTTNSAGQLVSTDWKSYIYQKAISHNHAITISGGSAATTYFLSAGYTDQEGILVGNTFKRLGVRANIEHKVTDWFTLTANSNYTKSDNASLNSGSLPGATTSTTGLGRLALALPPNVAAFNEDGSYNLNKTGGQLSSGANQVSFPLFSPVALFDLNSNTSNSERFIGRLAADIRILKKIHYNISYAMDRIRNEDEAFKSSKYGSDAYNTGGSIANTSALRNNTTFVNTLSYEDWFGESHINLLAGNEIQRYDNSVWGIRATTASDDFFEHIQGGWGTISNGTGSLGERVYNSYFGRVNYDFANRYFLTANFRRDGNSALATGKKYGNFGGASAGWLISNEDFFQKSALKNIFNSLKLSASWGRVGNGNLTNDYSSLALYNSALYGTAPTWTLAQVGSADLSWEISEQTNIGLNASFLNNRLQLEAAYFNNNVKGLILNTPLSPSQGVPGNSILANVGSLYNRGLELGLNARIISDKKFSWTVSVNYTAIQNKVTALSNGEDIIGYTGSTLNNTNITRVGYSVGSIYGAQSAGVNPENGQRMFINGKGETVQYSFAVAPGGSNWTYLDGRKADALTGADFKPLGNALPKWYGGIGNTFRYGAFDANVLFTYAGGNYIMNGTKTTLRDQIFFNNSTDMLRRWTKAGQVTDIPRLVYNDRISNGTQFSISENVEKGDFLRLQNLIVGYQVPTHLLQRLQISTLRVYAQATNLFLITGYSGSDPEISTNGNANTAPGVEFNSIGMARTFTFGINLGF